jgi:hypothetical protein
MTHVRYLDDGSIVVGEGPVGFIFYPGGKVESEAYIPLMLDIARAGVTCVIVDMPFKLAIFDTDKADEIREQLPYVQSWSIGGHSLGGSVASMHIEKSDFDYKALVLLGSYSTADLSDLDISVISIYGTEDKVMNREKYEKYRINLPSDFIDTEVFGFCHAYFGMYGEQKGDGVATVTNREQIAISANSIYEMILRSRSNAENN